MHVSNTRGQLTASHTPKKMQTTSSLASAGDNNSRRLLCLTVYTASSRLVHDFRGASTFGTPY